MNRKIITTVDEIERFVHVVASGASNEHLVKRYGKKILSLIETDEEIKDIYRRGKHIYQITKEWEEHVKHTMLPTKQKAVRRKYRTADGYDLTAWAEREWRYSKKERM